MIAGEILSDAYLFAGIGDQYNPLDSESTNLALRFLNDLCDSFSGQALKIFHVDDISLPLVSGTQTYTIGVGQPVTNEPPSIDSISILDSGGVKHPVKIIGGDEWQQIIFLAAPGRPVYCYPNQGANTIELNFWPKESFAGDVAHLFGWTPLQAFASVADVYTAPAGYPHFLKTALGKVLAAINKRTLTQDQKDIIAAAEASVTSRNYRRRILATDIPQDSAVGGGWFNIYTGYP